MKTLIINGSPRRGGDTDALVGALKARLTGEVVELLAYEANITPCLDCRSCREQQGCVVRDEMDAIYADDFDAVVIASPIFLSNLTAPLMGIASRFQAYYAARRIVKSPLPIRRKMGALLLVGGGDGRPDAAINTARWMLRQMNAEFSEENAAFSLQTDALPAAQDEEAMLKIAQIADRLNGGAGA
ncbi:MAG: flavodoxin family protein [Christensenellales bacterium]|jgi:multimeric flavodoxin WrbA